MLQKLLILTLLITTTFLCFINSSSSNGLQLIQTIGKEHADTIRNAQEIFVTDVRRNRQIGLSEDQMILLKTYLTNDSSYLFNHKKQCLFIPQLHLEFSASSNLSVLISMVCNQVKFITPQDEIILDYDSIKDSFNELNEKIINRH